MLFSIIIATYNAEEYLEQCLRSIINQSYKDFELIIIDGNSKDNTNNIIERYKTHITYFVSEKDNGIYDAWNKGLRVAKGDWIMFMGADDLLNDGILSKYHERIYKVNPRDIDFISGQIEIVKKDLTKIRNWGKAWNYQEFRKKIGLAHTTSLHSKFFFKKYGFFDETYKIAGDYEILLRPKGELKTIFVNLITGKQREGGISSKLSVFVEIRKLMIKTGEENTCFANYYFLKNYLSYFTYKIVSKSKELIKSLVSRSFQ